MPKTDRVGMEGEYDGDGFRRLSRGLHLSRRHSEDDVDIHAYQLGRKLRQLIDRIRPPQLNNKVLALDVAEVAQAGAQRRDPVTISRGGTETQEPHAPDLPRLLRMRGERPTRHRAG